LTDHRLPDGAQAAVRRSDDPSLRGPRWSSGGPSLPAPANPPSV